MSLLLFIRNWLAKNRKYLVVLIGVTFFAYFQTLRNGFVADDIRGVLKNNDLGNFRPVLSQPFYFVQPLLYYFQYIFFDKSPLVFHLDNLLFHTANVLAVFALAQHFAGKRTAFLTALLFAVHPLLSEAVIYVSAGSFVRATFFLLTAWLLHLAFRKKKIAAYHYLATGLFVLAAASSVQVLVFPFILVLYELLKKKSSREILLTTRLFFLISFIWGSKLAFSVPARLRDLNMLSPQPSVFYYPWLQIPYAVSTYLKLFLSPLVLTINYQAFDNASLMSFFLTIIFIASLVVAFFKNKTIFFFLLSFPLMLSPTLLPVRLASVVAERYFYPAAFGLCFIAGYFFDSFISLHNLTAKLTFVLLVILLADRTGMRTRDWQNEHIFWTKTVNASPLSFAGHYQLAKVYFAENNYEDAKTELETVIRLAPRFASAYEDLGLVYEKFADNARAYLLYLTALSLNQSLIKSPQNISSLLYRRGNLSEAERYARIALSNSPNSPDLLRNLATILFKENKVGEAQALLFRTATIAVP
ncbi:tetratricopeptide repeat protein [Candidatus Roizmanbacteria bacterium]|nr:tetratricopeptide repeat protein [Candidatus Roizmanbacteria bacterium]